MISAQIQISGSSGKIERSGNTGPGFLLNNNWLELIFLYMGQCPLF